MLDDKGKEDWKNNKLPMYKHIAGVLDDNSEVSKTMKAIEDIRVENLRYKQLIRDYKNKIDTNVQRLTHLTNKLNKLTGKY